MSITHNFGGTYRHITPRPQLPWIAEENDNGRFWGGFTPVRPSGVTVATMGQ